MSFLLFASESAGAALSQTINRIVIGGMLLTCAICIGVGLVLVLRNGQRAGWVPLVFGLALLALAGYSLVR